MYRIFATKHTFHFLVFLVIEQAIVASSTVWLVWLARGISGGSGLLVPFLGFICSLTLVYIPSVWRRTALSKAKNAALLGYMDICAKGLYCVPHLCRSKKFQHGKKDFIETESFLVIDETMDFADTFLGLALNVLFNVFALSFAFGGRLLWAYLCSAAIGVFMARLLSCRVKKDSLAMQNERTKTYSALGEAWDAITLGNKYNLDLWQKHFGGSLDGYKNKAASAIFNIEVFTAMTLWLSVVPALALMAYVMFSPQSGVTIKTIVLATLPRQILVTQYIAELINYLLKFSAVRERLSGLARVPDLPADITAMTGTVAHDRIVCTDPAGRRVDLDGFEPPARGRLTIRGGNGAGKSSLLMELKKRYPRDSVILPAHNRLRFNSVAGLDLSTGQKTCRVLDELCGIDSLKLVLLDEWDANLDSENMSKVDSMIERLAGRCCVMEIRHR